MNSQTQIIWAPTCKHKCYAYGINPFQFCVNMIIFLSPLPLSLSPPPPFLFSFPFPSLPPHLSWRLLEMGEKMWSISGSTDSPSTAKHKCLMPRTQTVTQPCTTLPNSTVSRLWSCSFALVQVRKSYWVFFAWVLTYMLLDSFPVHMAWEQNWHCMWTTTLNFV